MYVLRCGDGSLYTGITNNIMRRLLQHNTGVGSRYTRSRRPVYIVYQESCRGRSQALRKEYAFKKLTRSRKEASLKEKLANAKIDRNLKKRR